ncbi:hypothetical protein [Streptomyces alfalfae]
MRALAAGRQRGAHRRLWADIARAELSSLLKTLLDELADPRVHGFGISEDGIAMLHESSQTLANLEDHAFNLARAARALANLPDWITALSKAADEANSAANSLADSRFG